MKDANLKTGILCCGISKYKCIKYTTKILELLIFSVIFAAACMSTAFAYTTESFDVDVTVAENNSYRFVERIKVDFDEPKHGIYLYIPMSEMNETKIGEISLPKQREPKIDSEWVDEYNFEVYTEKGNKVIKIGNAEENVIGVQNYKLGYRMSVIDDGDRTKDFMYIDLLPTGWETAIDSAKIRVHMPKSIDESALCVLAGKYGETNAFSGISWNYDDESSTITISAKNLPKGVGISVFCELSEGYWQNQLDYDALLTKLPITSLTMGGILMLIWLILGRDKRVKAKIEFYPPKDLTPMELGYIADGRIDKKDVLSMIVYFAEAGYLIIEQRNEEKFVLKKVRDIDESEKHFAQTLFEGIFACNDYVELDNLGANFADAYTDAYDELNSIFNCSETRQITIGSQLMRAVAMFCCAAQPFTASLQAYLYSGDQSALTIGGMVGSAIITITLAALVFTEERKYALSKEKKEQRFFLAGMINLAGIVLVETVIFSAMHSALCIIGFAIGIFLSEFAACMMQKRTEVGIELMREILGFRNFIESATKEKISALTEEDPDYFYNILPYAYVLGVADEWADNFKTIKIETPNWINGTSVYETLRNSWYYSRILKECEIIIAGNANINLGDIDTGDVVAAAISVGGGFGGGGGGSW